MAEPTGPKDAATEPAPAAEIAVSDSPAAPRSAPQPEAESAGDAAPPPADEARESAQAMAPAAPRPRRGCGVFFGGLSGGVLAAVLGFAAARYVVPQGWPFGPTMQVTDRLAQRLDGTDAAMIGLKAQIGDLSKAVTAAQGQAAAAKGLADRLDQTNAALAGLQTTLGKTSDAVKQQLAGLGTRITALEKLPLASGAVAGTPDAAVLESLRAQLETQRQQNDQLAAEVKTLGEQANARIDAVTKEAQALKAEADATARAALARAALTRVQAALQLGGPFAGALKELTAQGVGVPDVLAKAATAGVPTQADLEAAFPDAARAALEASLKANMGAGFASRVEAFLRSQTGLRSLTPRPGKDPDAVLSRAQADLATGKLDAALKEIATLPVQGQAAMADWLVLAKSRRDALAAAESVAQSLSK